MGFWENGTANLLPNKHDVGTEDKRAMGAQWLGTGNGHVPSGRHGSSKSNSEFWHIVVLLGRIEEKSQCPKSSLCGKAVEKGTRKEKNRGMGVVTHED